MEEKNNSVEYNSIPDSNFEDRNSFEIIRDDSKIINLPNGEKIGKIVSYKFCIKVRDKQDLTGELTREQMDLIYRLYSSEGSSLTQRNVSRYFPEYTFQDFKRILRTFNVTKASSPLAPHVIEEMTKEDLVTITFQNKENDYLRKLEQDRTKITEVKLKEMTKSYYDLKQQIANFNEFLSELKFDIKIDIKKPKINSDKTLVVYLSDMHIGAEVSNYSIYNNQFDYTEAKIRFNKLFDRILT